MIPTHRGMVSRNPHSPNLTCLDQRREDRDSSHIRKTVQILLTGRGNRQTSSPATLSKLFLTLGLLPLVVLVDLSPIDLSPVDLSPVDLLVSRSRYLIVPVSDSLGI